MKFSLRELILAVIAAAACVGYFVDHTYVVANVATIRDNCRTEIEEAETKSRTACKTAEENSQKAMDQYRSYRESLTGIKVTTTNAVGTITTGNNTTTIPSNNVVIIGHHGLYTDFDPPSLITEINSINAKRKSLGLEEIPVETLSKQLRERDKLLGYWGSK